MALEPNGPAPYAPIQSVVSVIDTFRNRGLGTPLTTDVLVRAGVPESLGRRTLQSLRLLELIDDEGNPTRQFQDLRQTRGGEEYKERLGEWLRDVYADVLQYTDPAVDPPERVAEAFRGFQPAGQRLRMAALMLGLFEMAGLVEGGRKSQPRAPRPKVSGSRGGSNTKSATKTGSAPTRRSQADAAISSSFGQLPPGLIGLLHEIPPAGTSWSKERRDEFMRAFEVVLDFTVPIGEPSVEEEVKS